MRVLRDVVVERTPEGDLLAVCHTPGLDGEEMTLDLLGGGVSAQLRVRVLESRPVIVAGTVRYRLRLRMLTAVEQPAESAARAEPA